MKEYTIEFGETLTKTIYVYANNVEEAEEKAYLEIGYDPGEMFVFCEENLK